MTQWIAWDGPASEIGGKAASLAALAAARLPIPAWFAVLPPASGTSAGALPPDLTKALDDAVRQLLRDAAPGERLAVRSSAVDEDGARHSFAGQFESYLFVAPEDVAARVRDVWCSAESGRVDAYRQEHALERGTGLPAVLVQRMIDAEASGVAFSADPVSGQRGICVVDAVYGLGTSLVSGEANADSFRVDRNGTIVDRKIAAKRRAHRAGAGDVVDVAVPEDASRKPAIDDDQVRAVAALARASAAHFGRPQDIEWAIVGGRLHLLQSRAITSLENLPDPDAALALWDNSNITESYAGVTTPLTFSFARYVYEEVYRQFCLIVGVSQERIADNEDALRAMLGLVRGRIYYNLVSWYRLLALFPGYQLNRSFMEQMMGVKEGIPAEVAQRLAPPARGRLSEVAAVTRTLGGLFLAYRRLPRSIAAFHARLDGALGVSQDLSAMRADELVAHYRDLERTLLTRWDAPLINDFFAMVFHGVARKLVVSWCGPEHEPLVNDLVSGGGDIVSAEPAKRIAHMAVLASSDAALVDALVDGTPAEARSALAARPEIQQEIDAYLRTFGDRCLEELKLETETLDDDPMVLLRAVGRLARVRATEANGATTAAPDFRADAERALDDALGGARMKRDVLRWVVRHAADRVRDRENLRFERTRVFGRVRRIFVELGRRFAAVGALEDPRGVFYLTVEEALGWVGATTVSADLASIAAARKAEFARYRSLPAPDDRFETRGVVHAGHDFLAPRVDVPAHDAHTDGETRRGTGCFPGVVRGPVRVVREPRNAMLLPGEILVAERTDPGWIMLFPGALGLLVERGSLLSHSAIVARELRIPAVIAVDGLTTWLDTGDVVELDGRAGTIRRISRAGAHE
jgi:phosphohistidine swiveling domain-containing protein